MLIFQKVWLYGGWFYLSLFLAIVLSFFFKKKFKELILNLSLFLGFLICLNLFLKNLNKLPNFWQDFKLSSDQKINKTTFGQNKFAKDLRLVLPPDAQGCIYWSWDIPTRFLIQKLYPQIFVAIEKDGSLEKCDYLISQFKPGEVLNYQLIFSSEAGLLYKKK